MHAVPSWEPARAAPAPNYFGNLPPPQRGGGDEEDAVKAFSAIVTIPFRFPLQHILTYTNREVC